VVTAFFLFGVLHGVNDAIVSLASSADSAHLRVMSRVDQNVPLPLSHVEAIADVPGVSHVAGFSALIGTYQTPTNMMMVLATNVDEFFKIYDLKAPQAQLQALRQHRTGAIVGRTLATKQNLKIGDRVSLSSINLKQANGSPDWTFDIVGIYDNSNQSNFFFANYDYINEARGSGKNTVSQIAVGVTDPTHTSDVAAAIDRRFANSSNQTNTQSERAVVESMLRQVGDIGFIVNSIAGAVLFTLLFLTANTMAQSVRERTSELAVLKALGFHDATVQRVVLAESLALSLSGAAVGLAVAALLLPKVKWLQAFGIGRVQLPALVILMGLAIALALALASGVPPAWRARRLGIADALAAQ
jgi:putative ABC transport system permease protein